MTPQDIINKRFEKSMGGYKTEEVHQFLALVADRVTELGKENAELVSKMEVLAEKLEEYREDEDSLRAALIGAQKLGDSVVRESKRKAEAIIAGAVKKAEDIASDAQSRIDSEAYELEKMKREVAAFKKKLMELYTEHLKLIDCLPDDEGEVEVPQISYIPPSTETVKMELVENDEQGSEVESVTMIMDTGNAAVEEQDTVEFIPATSGGDKGKRIRYDKLDQFFGENNPVERE